MRTVCVLLVLIVAQQAAAAETRTLGDEQPAWLVAYECFQQVGDLIISGEYESAQRLLFETSEKLPEPYWLRARLAAHKLPRTNFGDDNLALPEYHEIRLDDPLGRSAARDPKFDARSADDLRSLAVICCDIEAYAAALSLQQRLFDRGASRHVGSEIVDLLYWTHGHPDEAERIIERSGDKKLSQRWRDELPAWRDRHQHASDPLSRLKFWHGQAPLARLKELELMRPHISTSQDAIGLEQQRVAMFAELRDSTSRDAAMAEVFRLVDNNPAICGKLLQNVVDHASGVTGDEVRHKYLLRIADEYPTSPQAGRAFAKFGREAFRAGDVQTAVRRYEQLFAWAEQDRRHWKVSDAENRRFKISLHYPAAELSLAYESSGDLTRALHYARLARDRHRYAPECVIVDTTKILEQIDERVRMLEARLAEQKAARIDGRTEATN